MKIMIQISKSSDAEVVRFMSSYYGIQEQDYACRILYLLGLHKKTMFDCSLVVIFSL